MILGTTYAIANTCKIKIYYDANGNRIQRILECAKEDSRSAIPMAAINKQNAFNDLTEGSYQVFPNPAESKVNVKLNAQLLAKGCSIIMTDLSGKLIHQRNKVDQTITSIDLTRSCRWYLLHSNCFWRRSSYG